MIDEKLEVLLPTISRLYLCTMLFLYEFEILQLVDDTQVSLMNLFATTVSTKAMVEVSFHTV